MSSNLLERLNGTDSQERTCPGSTQKGVHVTEAFPTCVDSEPMEP